MCMKIMCFVFLKGLIAGVLAFTGVYMVPSRLHVWGQWTCHAFKDLQTLGGEEGYVVNWGAEHFQFQWGAFDSCWIPMLVDVQ